MIFRQGFTDKSQSFLFWHCLKFLCASFWISASLKRKCIIKTRNGMIVGCPISVFRVSTHLLIGTCRCPALCYYVQIQPLALARCIYFKSRIVERKSPLWGEGLCRCFTHKRSFQCKHVFSWAFSRFQHLLLFQENLTTFLRKTAKAMWILLWKASF